MYQIVFYENHTGRSELYEEILELAKRAESNKDARIQFKQISYYIELLQSLGTNLPTNITKHIIGDIWELRPGNNRILYFFHSNDTYVLLHMFTKKTQKTPKSEIEKALKECDDYKKRNEVI